MDTIQEHTLRRNQVKFVDDLDPKDVLDDLIDDGVFTENDYELVSSGKSRKERCRIMLAMLPTRGPTAYGSFQRALKQNSYPHLEKLLHFNTLSDGANHSLNVTDSVSKDVLQADQVSVCSNCEPYFPTVFSDPKLSTALKRNCCLLLGNVEPCDILDWHYQKFVLGRDECDRIRSEKTRKERFVVFLEEISKCRSNNILSVFKLSLQKKYSFIVAKLDNNLQETVAKDNAGHVMEQVQHGIVNRSTVGKTVDCVTREQDDSLGVQQLDVHESETHSNDVTLPFNIETAPDLTKVSEVHSVPKLTKPTPEQTLSETYRVISMEEPIQDISFRKFDSQYSCDKKHLAISPMVGLLSDQTSTSGLRQGCVSPVSTFVIKDLPSDVQYLALSQADSACIPKQHLRPTTKSIQQTNKRRSTQREHLTDSEEDISFKQGFQKQRSGRKKHENGCFEETAGKSKECAKETRDYVLSHNPGSVNPGKIPNKRLEVAFNLLSTMINQGQYDRFEQFSNGLKHKYHRNADMMCILGYLHASKDSSAKKHINSAMELVPNTSNPKYFTLELFTALTRMYITQKKLQKLQRILDDAKMIIETDPVGCTGRAAGWLYMNDARNMTALIGMLNVHKSNFTKAYRSLHAQAKQSFQLSLANFQKDGGKDGPFGFGYALCRLVILLLQCGDSGLTMDVLHPSSDDIELAGSYLRQLEDSNIPISKILEVHYLLAKCDYQYRRNNSVRALEHADAAHRLATEINMLEFTEHAHNRVLFLRTKSPLIIETVDEEEAARILFEETADSSQ